MMFLPMIRPMSRSSLSILPAMPICFLDDRISVILTSAPARPESELNPAAIFRLLSRPEALPFIEKSSPFAKRLNSGSFPEVHWLRKSSRPLLVRRKSWSLVSILVLSISGRPVILPDTFPENPPPLTASLRPSASKSLTTPPTLPDNDVWSSFPYSCGAKCHSVLKSSSVFSISPSILTLSMKYLNSLAFL